MFPRLLVGLGNPTPTYVKTRHNAGRLFIDYLIEKNGFSLSKRGSWKQISISSLHDVTINPPLIGAILDSYMNESGPLVKKIMMKENIKPDEILIVVDDFSLPFGSLRYRAKGSAGGHNGIKSIIESLQTEDFPRLRIGIGPAPAEQDPADFVLKNFSKIEFQKLPSLFDALSDGLALYAAKGIDRAMEFLNKKHL